MSPIRKILMLSAATAAFGLPGTELVAQERGERGHDRQRAERSRPDRDARSHESTRRDADEATRSRADQARRHAERVRLSTEERGHLREYYRAEATHRQQLARMKRLYELAQRNGDERKIAKLEQMYAELHRRRNAAREQASTRVERREVLEAAERDLGRTRGHDGLHRRPGTHETPDARRGTAEREGSRGDQRGDQR